MSETSGNRADHHEQRRELRTIADTVRKDNSRSFANALELAAAIGATPEELSWLLIEILPQLEVAKSFWNDETLIQEFVSKLPASDHLLGSVAAALAKAPAVPGRSILLLGRRIADQDGPWNSEFTESLVAQLEASPDGLPVALRLSRRLDDSLAHPLLIRYIGDTHPFPGNPATAAQTIGELSGEMLEVRGYPAGLHLLGRMDEVDTYPGRVNAIRVLEALRVEESVDWLCYLVQDVTFGSTLAEVLLSENVLGPLLGAAEEAGALHELRGVLGSRDQWKPAPGESIAAPPNIAAFITRLHRSQVSSKLGAVFVSPNFFYSFVRIFFSRKILSAMRHLLSDADADVRIAAARALGQFNYPSATRALKEAIWDRSNEVRAAALASLRQHLSDDEIEAFIAERTARNEEMKAEARAAKEEFETIKIDNKFVNAVKSLGFSTYNVVSSAAGAAKSAAQASSSKATGYIKSVLGRKPADTQEDAT